MKNKRIPDIRFPGFPGDWEQHKLGDVTSLITKGTTPKDKSWIGPVNYIKTESIDPLSGNITIKANTSLEEHEGYLKRSKLKENDILFSIVGTLGRVGIVESKDLPANTNQQIAIIRLKDSNANFILNALKTNNIQSFIKSDSTIGAQPSLSLWQINDLQISVPISEEQKKIGTFFSQLDNLITLHQQELTTLKQTKQGFLQKMFPKEGESMPEVRFPGFTGEWEERKFFDNIKNTIDFRGRTPKKLGLEWSESGYLALSALNVKNGYIDPSADAHYGNEELYQKWMGGRELKQGQVLFTTEAPMGNVAQVPDNKGYILSQRTIAFDVHENKITNDFLRVLLCSPRVFNELSSLSSGGTAKGVSQKSLSQLKVEVPKSLKEQIQIGNFFKQLDDTIALHQRELDALKEMKKAFLQKMFA
ncbi:restriction endonuclease subunit S [Bacillus wiedmannii]|uniref:restriction endonuclease subunit S n=1 Tax=Bacillus wiedmannii TaxID=1890302 RepID=UPI003D959BF7